MNIENYQKALNQILDHPESWNQEVWHCGTQHCFAGWAQIMSGHLVNENTVRRHAMEWIKLDCLDSIYLFCPNRKLKDFKEFLRL